MKKILIVDQNKQSRTKLRIMLDDYAHDKREKIEISETESGGEAVMLCENEHYDLIFIDVEVSEMDSAKATTMIRDKNPKAFIIVSSDSQDPELRSRILRSGAEDYIKKPISSDLFYSRLDNYIDLIKSRKLHLSIHEAHNLYGHDTYGRTISYFIKEHDVLAEFWEYYLLETQETRTLTDACRRCNVGKSILNSHEASTRLSDSIRAIYDIAVLAVNINLTPHIWVEESDKNIYFTIEGISQINPDRVFAILNKIPELNTYKFEHYKVTVMIPRERVVLSKEIICNDVATQISKPITDENLIEQTIVTSATTDYTETETIIQYQIYNYMDEEDLEDIKENLTRLNTLLLMVGSGDIRAEEVDEIAFFLERIGKSASIYSESYEIARALNLFSSSIKDNVQTFIDKSSSLGLFCKTFGLDLTNWLQAIFYEGAPSVNFMNDTITSNAQMLSEMLTATESAPQESMDMDDIFAF
ncbi:MAG: response regulator, partial [Sulfuricurvum sp.]|uniref:response regulator n=1 Tax=Sulfuricurvum sp. TaxID=2025608 RepID=UPI0025D47CAC